MNFAFFDQVLVSACNFLGGILFARAFGVHEFGRFALAWMFIEFMGSIQFAAVIQPMLNIGPKQAPSDCPRYYNAVIAQQAVLCGLLAIVTWIGVSAGGQILDDPDLQHMALPLSAAVISYQLHNFFRRYFFARDRPSAALGNDALRFGVQLGLSVVLAFAWQDPTATTGVWVIVVACAVSAAQGAILFGRASPDVGAMREVLARHWDFSKWLLPSALMFWMTSQGFMIMSGVVLGPSATGALKVAVSITGILNILLLALDNFAPVQAARALHEGGAIALRRYVGRLALLTAVLTVAIVFVLNVAPTFLVHVLYGDQYQGVGTLVRLLCAPAAVYAASTVLVIWAAAMEQTRTIFISYVGATAFTLLAAYPITLYGGVVGVVVGSFLVEVTRVALLMIPLARWSKTTRPAAK